MWNFKIVLCNKDCDLKSCRSVDDYINNLDNCRGTAPVYRHTTIALSKIPLTGISNFYSGNTFDGVFELVEGLVALFSICCCTCCLYCCEGFQHRHDDNPVLYCQLFWSLLLAAINIVRYVICTNSFEISYEFFLAMVTVVIPLIFCRCGCVVEKRCLIASAIVNVIVVGLMEMIKDGYMAANNENDGNGCPFI